MCILAYVANYSARLPFVLISNRDEFLNRQTLELSWKYFADHILCALDVSAGGTWMGLEREHGCFAIITNCRRSPAAALTPFRQMPPFQLEQSQINVNMSTEHSLEQEHFTIKYILDKEISTYDNNCTDKSYHNKNSKVWRGAAPLEEILKNTKVKSYINESKDSRLERVLSYEPVTSRGDIVKEYLLHGVLPFSSNSLSKQSENSEEFEHLSTYGRECKLEKEIMYSNFTCLSPSLCPPYYAGYNLLTCSSLLGKTDLSTNLKKDNTVKELCSAVNSNNATSLEQTRESSNANNSDYNYKHKESINVEVINENINKEDKLRSRNKLPSQSPFALHYTTNRYGVNYNESLSDGTIHCLQNSYIDNWAEPKCAELRRLFRLTLENDISPLLIDADAQDTHSLRDETVLSMANILVDTCLNATPEFKLCEMMNNTGISNERRDELCNILHSNDPLNGFTADELIRWWGDGAPFTNGNVYQIENELQRNIFTREKQGYATRVQSVVFVEVLHEHSTHTHQKAQEIEFSEKFQTIGKVTAQESGNAEKYENTIYVVHFMQRATPAENVQDTSWKHFKLRSDEEALERIDRNINQLINR